MRTAVEIEAVRLAISHGDDAWEAGILSTLHRMRRHIERTGNEFHEGAGDFDRLHKGFHTALLAACGSQRMLNAHSDLYDQAYRYRRVMMRAIGSGKKFVREHQLLADRVLTRDVAGAQTMLAAHLRSTINFVYPPATGTNAMVVAAIRQETSVSVPTPPQIAFADVTLETRSQDHYREFEPRRCDPANSSASSGRRAAARPRRCGWRRGSISRPAAR